MISDWKSEIRDWNLANGIATTQRKQNPKP